MQPSIDSIPKDTPVSVNAYFDHVYVLNLSNRPDRKLSMLQKLSRLGIQATFVEAINGYNSPHIEDFQAYQKTPMAGPGAHYFEIAYKRKMIKSPGAWGYLKTYIHILQDAQKRDFSRILCFDDDAIFNRNFEQEFEKFVQHIPDDWKLLYLGASQHVWKHPHGFSYPDASITDHDPSQPFYFPKATDGSFAIGIDSSVFGHLLHETEKMNCSFDSGPMRSIINLHPEKCFVANPNIVIADVTSSDIQDKRDQEEVAEKLKWDLDSFEFPFKKDLVSVIMPAYDAEDTIEKAIQSILIQSYDELELIVVDDGSTDNTAQIVSRIAQKDKRVKLIKLPQNKGCYFARNQGLRASRGKVIAIQDADDVAIKDRLTKQLTPIYAGEADFTLGNIYRSRCAIHELDIYNQDSMIALVESRRIKQPNGKYDYRDREIMGFNTSVFKRKLFEELGLFWEHGFAADMEFAERILFDKMGKHFTTESQNAHTFLMYCDPIPAVYTRIEEVLVVSANIESTNISNQYKNKEKEEFIQQYQQRLLGKYSYQYPFLAENECLQEKWGEINYSTIHPKYKPVITVQTKKKQSNLSQASLTQNSLPKMNRVPFILNFQKGDWLYTALIACMLLVGFLGKTGGLPILFDASLIVAFLLSFFAIYHLLRSQQKELIATQLQESYEMKDSINELKKAQKEIIQHIKDTEAS